MMKRSTLFIAVAGICAVLAVSALMCVAQDKNAKPAQGKFVPSPVFSPPYPPLPHHFSDVHTIQILCQAPKGAIKRALMPASGTEWRRRYVCPAAGLDSGRGKGRI